MTDALAPFFGIGVPSAGPDAYPGTPPWAVGIFWGVILLLSFGLIWLAVRTRLKNSPCCGTENDDAQVICPEFGTDLPVDSEASVVSSRSRTSVDLLFGFSLAFLLFGCWVVVCIDSMVSPPRQFGGIEIRGTTDFRHRVVNALTMLRAKAPSTFGMVTNYIGVIAQAEHTGMAGSEEPPTSYISAKVVMQSTTALAAVFAHEALHSKLYHDFVRENPNSIVPYEIAGGELVEKQCCDLQVRVLQEIGAPAGEAAAIAAAWNPKTNRYWEIPVDQRDW